MKIKLVAFSRQDEGYIAEGVAEYLKRVKRYAGMEMVVLKPKSSADVNTLKEEEGNALLNEMEEADFLVLLDAQGKQLSSEEFAAMLQQQMNSSRKRIVFAIGGAYGFSDKIYKRAGYKLSLSKMTFPHQLCRLVFLEQLYRAHTILKNEKYHH